MSRELLKRAAIVLREVWDNDDCYCAPSVIELQKEIVAYLNLPEPDQSARVAELERSESFLKDAIEAAIRDTKYYRDESESRLEGLMSATEAKRRLIDKITSLEQVSPGNDMQLALHEGDKRNPQLAALQAREPLSIDEVVMKREPLSADQVREVYRTAFPKGPYVYTNDAFVFARMIEKAHGIGVNHE